ncbi:MAG: AAA family ATPase [Steroidobacteraceae bacterium]
MYSTPRRCANSPLNPKLVAGTNKGHVVIDEIQKLPEILEVVHLLIERKSGRQFILTGSSARKLPAFFEPIDPPGRSTRPPNSMAPP